jgi:hypothetical protein
MIQALKNRVQRTELLLNAHLRRDEPSETITSGRWEEPLESPATRFALRCGPSLAWCPANKFTEVERFAGREPVPASFGRARDWRFASAREAVRDASLRSRLLTSFSMMNGVPASHLLTGCGRDSVELFEGPDTSIPPTALGTDPPKQTRQVEISLA